MNRRDFMKWLGRLFAALPFVALVDMESEPETTEIWGVSPLADNLDFWLKLQALSLAETQEASMKFWHDKDSVIKKAEAVPWELEAPKEEAKHLSKILAEADFRLTPWLLEE